MAATMSRTAGWYRSYVVEAQWCGLARIGKDLRLAAKVAAGLLAVAVAVAAVAAVAVVAAEVRTFLVFQGLPGRRGAKEEEVATGLAGVWGMAVVLTWLALPLE